MKLLATLEQLGVHRNHRAHFLRQVSHHNGFLAARYRDKFKLLYAVRRPLLWRNLRMTLWFTRIPAFSQRESLIYGAISLEDTIDRFERGRGRISTYARTWIKARKIRASSNWVSALRDSGHTAERRMKTRAAAAAIRGSGAEPTPEDLVDCVESLELFRVAEVYRGRPLGARLAAIGFSDAPRLLDLTTEEPLHDEGRVERLSLIWSAVQDEIARLPTRKKKIVVARLGLLGGKTQTLAKIGRTLGLSRERVRQLEKTAFETLRHRALQVLSSDGEPRQEGPTRRRRESRRAN